jgi:hypothetical protein
MRQRSSPVLAVPDDTQPLLCQKCDQEARALQRKQKKAFELQQKLEAEQREHVRQIAELEEKIDLEVQALKDGQMSKERANAVQQKKADLADLTKMTSRTRSSPPPSKESSEPQTQSLHVKAQPLTQSTFPGQQSKDADGVPTPCNQISRSEEEWKRQKNNEIASNAAIDSIMEMIGLEDVKAQVLRIKAEIDTTTRQNSNLKNERFNVSLLGNPGTGMRICFAASPSHRLNTHSYQEKPPLLAFMPNF